MALSGTFQNYPVSSFGLYCEWSGVQSVTGNYTDVTLKVYLSYYTLDVGRAKRLHDLHQRRQRDLHRARHRGLLQRMEKEAAEDQNRACQPQRGRDEVRRGAVRVLAVFRHLFRRVRWNHYGFHHRDPERH